MTNNADGIRDCSSNQYHNVHFAERCRSVGLVPQRGYRGWHNTEISPDLLERIEALKLEEEAFTLFHGKLTVTKAPTKLLKWCCGCTNVRVAVQDFSATCNKCNGIFIKHL